MMKCATSFLFTTRILFKLQKSSYYQGIYYAIPFFVDSRDID